MHDEEGELLNGSMNVEDEEVGVSSHRYCCFIYDKLMKGIDFVNTEEE